MPVRELLLFKDRSQGERLALQGLLVLVLLAVLLALIGLFQGGDNFYSYETL